MVIKEPEKCSLRPTEILVHMDQDPVGRDRTLLLDNELIQELPAPQIPGWAPFLSLPDAAIVDRAVVDFCSVSYSASQWRSDWPMFFELIRLVWRYRLPVTGSEISDILTAHGVCTSWQKGLPEFFEKGIELLVHVNGRKPVKRRRTKTRLGQ